MQTCASAPLIGTGKNRESERIASLDGLRGIAILMVVFWHYYACVPRPEWVLRVPGLERVASYGWTGVSLFFVLSGFLIGRILVRDRGRMGYYRVFYARRALRILPAYFACLLVFVVTRALVPIATQHRMGGLFDNSAPWWSYLIFGQNTAMAKADSLGGGWLSVTWSLAVEEQFYLLLPFVVALTRPQLLGRVLIGLAAFAVAFRWFGLELHAISAKGLFVLLPSRIDALALGALVGTQFGSWSAGRIKRWIAPIGFIACAGAIHGFASSHPVYMAIYYTLFAGAFAFVLLHLCFSPDGRASGVLSFGPLKWCGRVSYFVYLFHEPVNYGVHYLLRRKPPELGDGAGLFATIAAFAVVLTLGEVSRRYFEEPLIRFGRRWECGSRLLLRSDTLGPRLIAGR